VNIKNCHQALDSNIGFTLFYAVPESDYIKLKSAESLNAFAIATSQYFVPDHKKKKEIKETIKKCLHDISNTHDVLIKSIIEQARKEKIQALPPDPIASQL
jgi:hypothetical protein